jgi:predicted nucleic acid-binding protein
VRSTSSRARRSFLDTVEIFRSQHGANLSFADAAIVHVARCRTDGLVATFDRDFLAVEGVSIITGERNCCV